MVVSRHHPAVSEMDCHWGVVVPSPISPGGRISLTGPNRDDSCALTTPRRAIIMPYIEAGELPVSNDSRYRNLEWIAGEPENRLRRRHAARVLARDQPANAADRPGQQRPEPRGT